MGAKKVANSDAERATFSLFRYKRLRLGDTRLPCCSSQTRRATGLRRAPSTSYATSTHSTIAKIVASSGYW